MKKWYQGKRITKNKAEIKREKFKKYIEKVVCYAFYGEKYKDVP